MTDDDDNHNEMMIMIMITRNCGKGDSEDQMLLCDGCDCIVPHVLPHTPIDRGTEG